MERELAVLRTTARTLEPFRTLAAEALRERFPRGPRRRPAATGGAPDAATTREAGA